MARKTREALCEYHMALSMAMEIDKTLVKVKTKQRTSKKKKKKKKRKITKANRGKNNRFHIYVCISQVDLVCKYG